MFDFSKTTLLFPILLFSLVIAQSTLSSIPRNVPLINRSPYFGAWTAAPEGRDNHPTPAGANVTTPIWRVLDWNGFIRVDGEIWQWLGNETSITPATTLETRLTATRTMYTMEAGNVAFNITFLSPIETDNFVRLSFPFAYIYVDVWSKDGGYHSVQFFSEVAASLVTTRNDTMVWETTETGSSVYHEMNRRVPLSTDSLEMVENGILYFAMPNKPWGNTTWQTGPISQVRQSFTESGMLQNTRDTEFRSTHIVDQPVLAFSIDLGRIQRTEEPILWALGHVRNDLLTGYSGGIGVETRISYFWSQYPSIAAAIDAFLSEFPEARERAEQFDEILMTSARTVSQQYADLVSHSVRQTMAAIEITLPKPLRDKPYNTSNVLAYMRDTGISTRASPVEVMYAAMPALLYLNPALMKALLEPLLIFQASSRYENLYASPDLGDAYTYATGNRSSTKNLGVESCGNMLIMTLVHAMHTKDYNLINRYSTLLAKWADFLMENALHPKDQISADGLGNPDMSNLALKGILGIYAMSKIQEIVDPGGASLEVAFRYRNASTTYAKRWEALAVSRGHVTSVYGQPATWTMVYNYFPASMIAPTLFNPEIFADHAIFYRDLLNSAPASSWGLPYDSLDSNLAKSHWTMLTAAPIQDTSIRNSLIETVHRRTFWRGTAAPFGTTWSIDTGNSVTPAGRNSPAQGAMFAILATKIYQSDSKPNPGRSESDGKGAAPNVGAIAGGAVGGVVILLIVFGVLFLCKRKRGPFKYTRPKSRYLTNISPKTSFCETMVDSPGSRHIPSTPIFPYHLHGGVNGGGSEPAPPGVMISPFNTNTPNDLHSGGVSPTSSGQPSPVSKELIMMQRRVNVNTSRSMVGSSHAHNSRPSVSVLGSASSEMPASSTRTYHNNRNRSPSQLQQEVEELRREVHALRAHAIERESVPERESVRDRDRAPTPYEPPPSYKHTYVSS